MTDAADNLAGTRVLVAEDELYCALELEQMLEALECSVVGPACRIDEVPGLAGDADCALLDVNLKGERSYPVALGLKERGIPFAFVTGYTEPPDCPEGLTDVPRLGKPFSRQALADMLAALMKSA